MEQKIDIARNNRDMFNIRLAAAEKRTGELADEFTKLEVQIAIILFSAMGLFLKWENGKDLISSPNDKVILVLIFATLLLSLALGLLHIKLKEKFWERLLTQRDARFMKWKEVVEGEGKIVTFGEAAAFEKGSAIGGNPIVTSADWTWILQTICLGIPVILMFILFMRFIF